MYYYKFGAGSYEEHHEKTLIHENRFSQQELSSMFEEACIVIAKEKLPEAKQMWKEYLEDKRERGIQSFLEGSIGREMVDYYLDPENDTYLGVGMEDVFYDIVSFLCSHFGFRTITYQEEYWTSAWGHIYDIEVCPHCKKDKLIGEKFHGDPLPHNCKENE